MLVNNTVVCDHFKSIVAGGGQNGKKETTCGRPSGVTPSMGITLMQDTYPPSALYYFFLALRTFQNTILQSVPNTLNAVAESKDLVTMANDICLRFQMTLIILQGVIGDTMVAQ